MLKMKSFFKLMIVAGIVFGIFFGVGTGLTRLFTTVTATDDPGKQDQEEQATVEDGERTSILVLGVDARPGDDHPRSDTMLLATIDPELDKVAVVSIPRDTKVKLKNGQVDKINAANTIGGPQYAVDAVERLMDTNIDYYIEMDFNGFKDIVDTLGGVTINVPQRMYKPSEDINLHTGTQKLNGEQALAFVRFRDYPMGDIERTVAQQEFLKALAAEVLKPGTITKLPRLAKKMNQYTKTNLGLTDMLRIASWAPGFNKDSLVTQTLPGAFYDERDSYGTLLVSYWLADEDYLPQLVDNMLAGKTVAVVQQSTAPAIASAPVKQPDEQSEEVEEQETPSPDVNTPETEQETINKPETGEKSGEKRESGESEANTPENNNNEPQKPVNIEPPKTASPTPDNTPAEKEAVPVNKPMVNDPTGPQGYI